MDVRRLRSGAADDRRRSGYQRGAVAARAPGLAASFAAVREHAFTSRDRRVDPRRIGCCAGRRVHQWGLSSHSNPVAAAAPAVVALGISVIAIRIVEYLCRRLSIATLDSSAVASFLAVRRIGRRPTVLREGRTLVIAVALACFAVSAWSVARANRLTAARFSIGARTVVTVTADDRQLDKAVDAVTRVGASRWRRSRINLEHALMAVDATRLPPSRPGPTGRPARASLRSAAH